MGKTILRHNGSCPKGKEIIKKLLSENNLTTNDIKNKVICVDAPEAIYQMEEFLSFDEFIFLPNSPDAPVDISQAIDRVIIVKGN